MTTAVISPGGRAAPASRHWLLVYNCLHLGLGNCLSLLARDLQVDVLDFASFERRFDEFRGKLDRYDRIVTAPHFVANACVDFNSVAPVSQVPLTAFEAYHPDLCYIFVDGQVLRGPMFDYHSKIITAAYRRGLPVSAVRALFTAEHYERFGFFGIWNACKAQYLDSYRAHGLELAGSFPGWSREGVFMHSVNHPTIRVVADIARALLAQDGIAPAQSDFLPHDNLKNAPVWPVYPEIAESLGVRGSKLFKVHNEYRFLDLDEFIAGSYAVLGQYPAEKIEVFPMYQHAMSRIEACL